MYSKISVQPSFTLSNIPPCSSSALKRLKQLSINALSYGLSARLIRCFLFLPSSLLNALPRTNRLCLNERSTLQDLPCRPQARLLRWSRNCHYYLPGFFLNLYPRCLLGQSSEQSLYNPAPYRSEQLPVRCFQSLQDSWYLSHPCYQVASSQLFAGSVRSYHFLLQLKHHTAINDLPTLFVVDPSLFRRNQHIYICPVSSGVVLFGKYCFLSLQKVWPFPQQPQAF